MVKINIKLPAYGETRSLEQTLKRQLALFFKKNKHITEADVKMVHGAGAANEKVCEIYLKTGGRNIFTIQAGSSFEGSLLKAINKLQSQLDAIISKTT